MGLLWDSSHWTPSGFSLYCTSVCLGGWILLFNPLISWGMIWCWPGRLAKPGVEGQITATDVQSNHICFIAEKERVHSHTGLDSLVTLWIYLFIYLFFDKTGYWNSANCLCIEIYPHCIFDDEGLSHATVGNDSAGDKRRNSIVTGASAKRAILQNYNSLALMHVSEALNMNLSAEFHAENKR